MTDTLIHKIYESVQLNTLPQAIPPEYRPLWRIGQIVLIMYLCGRRGRCSRLHLHVLSWGLSNASSRRNLILLADGEYSKMDSVAVRFDPTLVFAVNLAAGVQLLEKDGKDSIRLTERGFSFAETITADPKLFEIEKATLARIGKKLTGKQLKEYVEERIL